MIFLQGLTHLIDGCLIIANSAISTNVFVRSWLRAGLTVFGTPIYHILGVTLRKFLITGFYDCLIETLDRTCHFSSYKFMRVALANQRSCKNLAL